MGRQNNDQTRKILLVDDESSGEAAVEALSRKDFDLVITDLNMYQ
jgi:CheY-like chemotaxis protein